MGTHHLILGETTDYLTGRTVNDTHDERARQKIAKLLVEQKGYKKTEVHAHLQLTVELEGKSGTVPVDFLLRPCGRPFMLVLFRPGSLVSRHRPALAAARLFEKEIIPYSAVTNGEEADVMDTSTGKVVSTGMQGLFSRSEATKMLENAHASVLSPERREKETRILFAMEVLSQKECDDYTCEQI